MGVAIEGMDIWYMGLTLHSIESRENLYRENLYPSDCPLWLKIPSTIVLNRPVWLKTNILLVMTTFDY